MRLGWQVGVGARLTDITLEVEVWHLGSTLKNMIKQAVLDGSVWLIFGFLGLVWFS